MTIIAASIWGGRISVVVDRQISQRGRSGIEVVDSEASKLLVVLCANALFSISYTGIAVAAGSWMDEAITSCLALKEIKPALAQPSSFLLARPVHELLRNLAFNLPIRLRSAPEVATLGLTMVVTGWHLAGKCQPFLWEIAWKPGATKIGGALGIKRLAVAKHFRQYPSGLWLQTWGDTGSAFDERLIALAETQGMTHDDVERYVVDAVAIRSHETATVGPQCLALQLDPNDREGHVQFTYYPSSGADDPHSLLSGWVLTPTLIHSPTRERTSGGNYSKCGRYVTGGFSDPNTNLFIRTRLPIANVSHGGPFVMSYMVQKRKRPPR